MECVNCGNQAQGKSKYCSDRCKVAYNRNNRNTVTVTDATVTPTVTSTVTPKRTRTTGCRVAIPGDEDYVGCCECVDGKWQVKAK